MKTLQIFSFLLALTLLSCTKTNTEGVNPNPTNNQANVADYGTLIVGKWQLTDMGIVTTTCPDPNCPMYKTEVIVWTKTTNNEILNFTNAGQFTKETATDEACKGTFRVIDGQLYINAKCAVESSIRNLTQASLIFGKEDQTMRYKYVKI